MFNPKGVSGEPQDTPLDSPLNMVDKLTLQVTSEIKVSRVSK